ncbi:dehydrogenase [Kurthia zopfii]|uniref:Acyl-CoA dehydrogenase, short-chain specific n=1 Tax=Kurthia zopfii TaxID=1650 RepID=A0A8B4QAE4_9BACL|nr:acyl-CoA dehydrogenase family protein [Kurthia zopfii]PWI21720.1 acyl-CoA dehydrogenase [Kurthia zopfii]TDR35782.1 alkylation response protein AidB-like acyl-CoA dehydrogenase [Kurthia zopfii]GEK31149.1 dehydrogenase [Kurthia zopfii]STX09686.1 Acyl-CoA dehydrogenase, short-chain specific [Kurthia zopfii]
MDFSLSEEQEMFRNYVRKSLADFEGTQVARKYLVGDVNALTEAQASLTELGCPSLNIPEQYDGMGLGALDLVPIYEEAGAVLLPGLMLETWSFASPLIQKYGTDQQKQDFLPKIASGEITFSIAWLEPESSYRPAGVQVTAQGGKLNGKKILVPDAAIADYFIVVARSTEGREEAGVSLVIMPASDASIQPQLNIDSTRKVAAVVLNEVAFDQSQLLGEVDQGWSALQEGLLSFNAALSSMIVGSLDRIVTTVTDYANIREQFGQPIGRFQAIKHRIVEMKMDLETARSLAHYANWAYETHAEDRVQAVFSARIFCTDAFNRVAAHSVQIHGGIGFTEELDCHLYVKRARFYENYLGSTEQYYEETAKALGW